MTGLTSLLSTIGSRLRYEPVGRRLLFALVVFVMVAATAYSLFQMLDEDRGDHLRRMVDSEAERTRTEFTVPLDQNVRLVEDLARRADPRGPGAGWDADARVLLDENPQFRAVAWFDTLFTPAGVVPPTARLGGFDLDPRDDSERMRHLLDRSERQETAYSASVVLADGRRQIFIETPVKRGDLVTGYVVGVLRLRDLIDDLCRPSLKRGYSVAVYEGPFLLFGPVWDEGGDEATWETDTAVRLPGLFWTVQVWPSKELLAEVDPHLPEWTLAFGLLLALLFAIGVYRFLVWKERAQMAERVLELAGVRDITTASGPFEPIETPGEFHPPASVAVDPVTEAGPRDA